MVSKFQLFSIYSFLRVLLDPHKINNVGKELTKLVFLLFECEIMLYMLTHFFNVKDQKPIHLVIILENNEWFFMLHSYHHIIQPTYFLILIVECKLVVLLGSFESL
jgi:hypothetical protein